MGVRFSSRIVYNGILGWFVFNKEFCLRLR